MVAWAWCYRSDDAVAHELSPRPIDDEPRGRRRPRPRVRGAAPQPNSMSRRRRGGDLDRFDRLALPPRNRAFSRGGSSSCLLLCSQTDSLTPRRASNSAHRDRATAGRTAADCGVAPAAPLLRFSRAHAAVGPGGSLGLIRRGRRQSECGESRRERAPSSLSARSVSHAPPCSLATPRLARSAAAAADARRPAGRRVARVAAGPPRAPLATAAAQRVASSSAPQRTHHCFVSAARAPSRSAQAPVALASAKATPHGCLSGAR